MQLRELTITAFPGARRSLVLKYECMQILHKLVYKVDQIFHLNLGVRLAIHGSGVKLKLFCPEAKNNSPLFKFIELWGADLIEWRSIFTIPCLRNFEC
jgi:hypothetical protein